MKTIVRTLSVCLVVVCVAGSVVLISGFHSSRQLREANQKLGEELRAAQARTDALLAEKQDTAKKLTLLEDFSEGLQARIAQIETVNAKEAGIGDTVPSITPYQTPAYVGQKFLGQVWIVPRNLRKDTNTQKYVYEQVVWLDERSLESFVAQHMNVGERAVESQTYVNNTYYPQPYYYAGYPIYYRPRTNHFQSNPQPTPAPPPTVTPPPRPTVNPGSGAVMMPRFGIPTVPTRTRPQLPSRPPGPTPKPLTTAGGTRTTIP